MAAVCLIEMFIGLFLVIRLLCQVMKKRAIRYICKKEC